MMFLKRTKRKIKQRLLQASFMLRGRYKHIDFLRLLFLVGMIDDLPSDARAFSLTSFER